MMPAAEARAGLVEPDSDSIAGDSAGDEDHVAVRPAHALAPECQVVDGEGQAFPALGSGHGHATIKAVQNESIGAPERFNAAPAPASSGWPDKGGPSVR